MAVRKIEKTAKTVYDARNELRSLKKSFTNELNLTENWWQGEAQKTFNNEFRDIDSQITALFRHMQNLESQLKRLSSEVRRADEARRRAAEKRKLEALR
jgi:WXG100 family type VII secretion target